MRRDYNYRKFQKAKIYKRILERRKWTEGLTTDELVKDSRKYNYDLHYAILREVATRPLCSRACCGNPRRFYKEVTLQERRVLELERFERRNGYQ